MIANNIIDDSHLFDGKKSYIVDTNVLLSLYGHPNFCKINQENKKIKRVQVYLNKAINSNSKVYVPAIVISEFLNRCLRESFKDYIKNNSSGKKLDYKKDYRKSIKYKNDLKYYSDVLKSDIFSKLTYINDNFDNVNITTFFTFNNDDFNDKIIKHIANENNLYIISADIDMQNIQYS